jgi:hypothetical protein
MVMESKIKVEVNHYQVDMDVQFGGHIKLTIGRYTTNS